jgi:hypothetical protein
MPRNINASFYKICGKSATMVYRKISILQSVEVYTVVWSMAMGGLRGMSSLQLLFSGVAVYEDSLSEVGKQTFL